MSIDLETFREMKKLIIFFKVQIYVHKKVDATMFETDFRRLPIKLDVEYVFKFNSRSLKQIGCLHYGRSYICYR